VLVIDDGSEGEHLSLIQQKYPRISIAAVSEVVESSHSKQPFVRAWSHFVSKGANDYFLLLEDDQWLDRPANIGDLIGSSSSLQLLATRVSNHKGDSPAYPPGDLLASEIASVIEVATQKLAVWNPRVLFNMKTLPFAKTLVSALLGDQRLGRVISRGITGLVYPSKLKWENLSPLNFIAGSIYEKEFWLSMWDGVYQIDENVQIRRTLSRLSKESQPRLGVAFPGFVRMSYRTSATDRQGLKFGAINKCLSEAWFSNQFDVHTLRDWDMVEICDLLEAGGISMSDIERFRVWQRTFEGQSLF
jgi:hypothetical protein